MNFQIGDRVVALDEDLAGVVCEISEQSVIIETNDGFKLSFSSSELIKDKSFASNIFEGKSLKSIIDEKESVKKHKSVKIKPKERNLPAMEVDLHIEQITTRHKHLSNFDILNLQIDTARYKLEFAIKKRIQKIVFIHGVGGWRA